MQNESMEGCLRKICAAAVFIILFGWCPTAQAGSQPAQIAYIDEHTHVLFSMTVGKSSHLTLVAGSADFPGSPKWSPNGQELAYTALDGLGGVQIVFANRAGKKTGSVLAGTQSVIRGIDWSPDGKRMAYICGTPIGRTTTTDWEVCVVELATGEHHAITSPSTNPLSTNGDVNRSTISWSPNGSDIAFEGPTVVPCTVPQPGSICSFLNIYSVNVDTGVTTQITTTKARHAQYSPNGQYLVYDQGGVTNSGIAISDAFGGGARLLVPSDHASGGFGPNPAWSPDGKQIVFDSSTDGANNFNTDLFVVNVDGPLDMTRITNTPNDNAQPAWTGILSTCTVPKLKGQTFAKAKSLLKKAGCTLGTITGPKINRATRIVKKQSVAAKTDIPSGTPIDIKIKEKKSVRKGDVTLFCPFDEEKRVAPLYFLF